jgi:CHAT domain-containing protein
VDDEAAATLMEDFYREVASGRPAADALQRAQALHHAEHPSRWAAFIHVGVAPVP